MLPFIQSAIAPVWELVRSADRAAAASRIAQLEEDIEATLRDLQGTRADLKWAHEKLQAVIGTQDGSTEQRVAIDWAVGLPCDAITATAIRHQASASVASLTSRQREVLDLVLAGHPSKNIAADLGISQRTVDNHRAAIMRKTGSKSVPALVRIAMAAA